MFESGVMFELNKFAYVGSIGDASSSRKDDVSNGHILVTSKKETASRDFCSVSS